jgi:hypothetical protein
MTVIWVTVKPGGMSMILRQFLHTNPIAISYLFGCGGHAACAVVDPVGDITPYQQRPAWVSASSSIRASTRTIARPPERSRRNAESRIVSPLVEDGFPLRRRPHTNPSKSAG